MKTFLKALVLVLLSAAVLLGLPRSETTPFEPPAYDGRVSVELDVSQMDLSGVTGEVYSPLDLLGRCGPAEALVAPETMPAAEREGIGMVRPSGWQLAKYDFIDGRYLYNRCHLIGYQLTGQNANERNLITGTRHFNVEGMLPYENRVANYVRDTGHHVRYRVTPVFEGENLLVSGVRMEAASVEDDGLRFHVYVHNVQPGVVIDYADGTNHAETAAETPEQETAVTYVLNTRSMKFHLPDCSGAAGMSPVNRRDFTGTREEALGQGYSPCGTCKP